MGGHRGTAGHLAVCALAAALHENIDALGRAGAALARGEAEAPAVCIARARQRQQRRVCAGQRVAAGGMHSLSGQRCSCRQHARQQACPAQCLQQPKLTQGWM